MIEISTAAVQEYLDQHKNKPMYIHLETTNGAYASHMGGSRNVGVFIRNIEIKYSTGKITGNGPFRIGIKLEQGWAYGEGLSHYIINDKGQLLLAGHDEDGRLAVAFELSPIPYV